MSKSLLTTKKIKKITKADGTVICLNNYIAYRKHKSNYNMLLKMGEQKLSETAKLKLDTLLKENRYSAIESYKLAFCLN